MSTLSVYSTSSFQPLQTLKEIRGGIASKVDLTQPGSPETEEIELIVYEYQKLSLKHWSSENLSDSDPAKFVSADGSFESPEFKDVAEFLVDGATNKNEASFEVSDWAVCIAAGFDPFGWEYSMLFAGPYRSKEFSGSRVRRRKWDCFVTPRETKVLAAQLA